MIYLPVPSISRPARCRFRDIPARAEYNQNRVFKAGITERRDAPIAVSL
jgi:hypothetical protein